jgi:hypothetical protein
MELMRWIRVQAERVAAMAAVLAGGICLLLGWLGVSSKVYLGEQIPYIVSGGLLGISLIAIGSVLWLSADLADEWRKLDRIEDALRSGACRLETTSALPKGHEPGNGREAVRNTSGRTG